MIGGHFFFQEKQLRFRIRDLWMPVGDLLGTYCKYCIPVLCSDMLLGIGNSMVSVIIGHIGTSFVAANSIVAMHPAPLHSHDTRHRTGRGRDHPETMWEAANWTRLTGKAQP